MIKALPWTAFCCWSKWVLTRSYFHLPFLPSCGLVLVFPCVRTSGVCVHRTQAAVCVCEYVGVHVCFASTSCIPYFASRIVGFAAQVGLKQAWVCDGFLCLGLTLTLGFERTSTFTDICRHLQTFSVSANVGHCSSVTSFAVLSNVTVSMYSHLP